jgi:hypothetical protein
METTQHNVSCSKCKGRMEQGFTIDSRNQPNYWVQGVPAVSALFGVTFEAQPIPIATFRCTSCGYLEAYARYEFAPK